MPKIIVEIPLDGMPKLEDWRGNAAHALESARRQILSDHVLKYIDGCAIPAWDNELIIVSKIKLESTK